VSNVKFQNALQRKAQACPPIWFMRQAGRYHKHYQKLRAAHGFVELCKVPELAAEVTLGPIMDFDFDVAILFSDLLFPLEALGMKLEYSPGPTFDRQLTPADFTSLPSWQEALPALEFQGRAAKLTRERLPKDKSLIGFVGGPWTLFSYAVGGSHDGSLIKPKSLIGYFPQFCETLLPLLKANVELQIQAGCEVVMVFDTSAGELDPHTYETFIVPALTKLGQICAGKVAYYSKGTHDSHLKGLREQPGWLGFGFDHRWKITDVLRSTRRGFVQGNFDQALLFSEPSTFLKHLEDYLRPLLEMSANERAGWVCGLGHGVLPQTPEDNVRTFVKYVRERFG
jgi:uroporphyrinogen decarboxylase